MGNFSGMDQAALKYKIALSMVPGIGDVRAKNLVAYCGSVEAVFHEKHAVLKKIPGVGRLVSEAVKSGEVLNRAEEEMEFMEKEEISALFFLDDEYPKRLKHCEDAPVLIYYKGNADLNAAKVISVVGSRKASDYGKTICKELIKELASQQVLVVSGMAYGIDTCAHRAALDEGLDTVGVLAHGLDLLYPSANTNMAMRMLNHGGLLTEFPSATHMHPDFFPRRNRIIAGIADAVIVVEASRKSGSLITAEIANSYSRDVFAVPGRLGDTESEGCNYLVKINKAALLQSAKDVVYLMGWERLTPGPSPGGKGGRMQQQQQLFVELNPEEEALISVLKKSECLGLDDLCFAVKMSMSRVSAILLKLEFAGLVRTLPGKMYRLN